MRLIPALSGFLCLFLIICVSAHSRELEIIYGDDDRYPVDNYFQIKFQDLARSVAGKVFKSRLQPISDNPGYFRINARTAKEVYPLCPEERFADEPVLTSCSGFLVEPDVLLTAGHCIHDEFDCLGNYWVFDYRAGKKQIHKSKMYRCQEIIARYYKHSSFKAKDYALIRLEREVTDRRPLILSKKRRVKVGTPLVVIGHPLGLPLQIADGAKVVAMKLSRYLTPIRSLLKKRYYFTANLDTFAGNSGSPVFDQNSQEVVGMLIRGGRDFNWSEEKQCVNVNYRDDQSRKKPETVFKIKKVHELKHLF